MFEFLDHPSEARVHVKASTVAEVFRDAAIALFEIMTDTKTIQPLQSFQLQATAPERHLLLIDWLNELILLHETQNVFLCSFEVAIQGEWTLNATVKGEKVQPHHERRSHAKSATYGQLQWSKHNNEHDVFFVIDI